MCDMKHIELEKREIGEKHDIQKRKENMDAKSVQRLKNNFRAKISAYAGNSINGATRKVLLKKVHLA